MGPKPPRALAPHDLLQLPIEVLRCVMTFVPVEPLIRDVGAVCVRLRQLVIVDAPLFEVVCRQEGWRPCIPRRSLLECSRQPLAFRRALQGHCKQLQGFMHTVRPACAQLVFQRGIERVVYEGGHAKLEGDKILLPDDFQLPQDLQEFYRVCDGVAMTWDSQNCIQLDRFEEVMESMVHWVQQQALENEEETEDEEPMWWTGMHRCKDVEGSPLWLPIGCEDQWTTLFCCCDKSHPDFGCISSTRQTDAVLSGTYIAPSFLDLMESFVKGFQHLLTKVSLAELYKLRDNYTEHFEMFRCCQSWLDLAGARAVRNPAVA